MNVKTLIDWLINNQFHENKNAMLCVLDESEDGQTTRYIVHYNQNNNDEIIELLGTFDLSHLDNSQRIVHRIQDSIQDESTSSDIDSYQVTMDAIPLTIAYIEDDYYYLTK